MYRLDELIRTMGTEPDRFWTRTELARKLGWSETSVAVWAGSWAAECWEMTQGQRTLYRYRLSTLGRKAAVRMMRSQGGNADG